MHDAEPVGDEEVGQRGELFCERSALGRVLARLAGVEPEVLQEDHVARTGPVYRRGGRLPHGVGGEGDRMVEQLAEPLGDRSQ
jgi:hypothetical protein